MFVCSALVPKRAGSVKIAAKGVFKGAIVVRGTDWEWCVIVLLNMYYFSSFVYFGYENFPSNIIERRFAPNQFKKKTIFLSKTLII